MKTRLLASLLLALYSSLSCAEIRNLTEQENCYLNALKGASGDVKVQTLLDACSKTPTALPEDTISQEMEQQAKPQKAAPAKQPAAKIAPTPIIAPLTPSTPAVSNEAAPQPAEVVIPTATSKAPTAIDAQPLPAELVDTLSRSIGISANEFSGEIYNPSKEWIVTEVTFRIWPKGANAATDAKQYPLSVEVQPQKSSPFFLKLGKSVEEVDWEIVQAKGKPFTKYKSFGEEFVDAILHQGDE